MPRAQAGKLTITKIVVGRMLELHSLSHLVMTTLHLDSKLHIITRQHASIEFQDRLKLSQQRLVDTHFRDKIAQAIYKNLFRILV